MQYSFGNRTLVTVARSGTRGTGGTKTCNGETICINHGIIMGNNNTITGNHNAIVGRGNFVTGNHNMISGEQCRADGNHNMISGNQCRVDGNHNKIVGNNCQAAGRFNTSEGKENINSGSFCTTNGVQSGAGDDASDSSGDLNVVMANNKVWINGVLQESDAVKKARLLRKQVAEETRVTVVESAGDYKESYPATCEETRVTVVKSAGDYKESYPAANIYD